jgi:8-oxo-dGTP pyrophosphatase MutT (NUDIX family)
MDPRVLEKVTVFVTRGPANRRELLLFEHPNAGIQIPAGTVEVDEEPIDAALREAIEETGIGILCSPCLLAEREEPIADGLCSVLEDTDVYARPDTASASWARLRRGIAVVIERRSGELVQVTYRELDSANEPNYVTCQITGWVPRQVLTEQRRRSFYRIEWADPTPSEWTVNGDVANCRVFWAPMDALPSIVAPQHGWLPVLFEHESDVA